MKYCLRMTLNFIRFFFLLHNKKPNIVLIFELHLLSLYDFKIDLIELQKTTMIYKVILS